MTGLEQGDGSNCTLLRKKKICNVFDFGFSEEHCLSGHFRGSNFWRCRSGAIDICIIQAITRFVSVIDVEPGV